MVDVNVVMWYSAFFFLFILSPGKAVCVLSFQAVSIQTGRVSRVKLSAVAALLGSKERERPYRCRKLSGMAHISPTHADFVWKFVSLEKALPVISPLQRPLGRASSQQNDEQGHF